MTRLEPNLNRYCFKTVSFGLPSCAQQCATCVQAESDTLVQWRNENNVEFYNQALLPTIPTRVEHWRGEEIAVMTCDTIGPLGIGHAWRYRTIWVKD